jgi:hypothetical protein
MSSASSTLPSPAELENLGVLFIGFVAATVLYGLTFFRMLKFSRTTFCSVAENDPSLQNHTSTIHDTPETADG